MGHGRRVFDDDSDLGSWLHPNPGSFFVFRFRFLFDVVVARPTRIDVNQLGSTPLIHTLFGETFLAAISRYGYRVLTFLLPATCRTTLWTRVDDDDSDI